MLGTVTEMSAAQPAHVLILGCGRSGTSIFGELFEHLTPYTYLSEPLFGDYLRADFHAPVAAKVPAEDDAFDSTPGLSFPLDALLDALPTPRRIYWIVRHPLDAVCSLRPGISKNWGHHPQPPDWQDRLDHPLIEQCAHHWNYINSVGYSAVSHLVEVKRFEDMIHDPRGFAYQIGDEVGLARAEHERELKDWFERVQDTNNDRFVEAKTSRTHSRPDHTRRVSRWRENLTAEEVRRLVPMLRETATRFGYDLDPAADGAR